MPSVIALDAMGSDRAPKPEIEGAIQAARQYGVRVLLIGPETVVKAELERHSAARRLPIEIVHASEYITMDDKVEAIRAKRDSSMRVGLRMVREGQAAGFVTAGNTGAAMATAKIVLGAVPGVDRPALAAVFPTAPGNPAMLLDVGANVDCTAQNLEQFAVMGDVYFRAMFGRKPGTRGPRVGLLSIGEEESKGNDLTREAFQLLKQLPLNFVGNVEGRAENIRRRRESGSHRSERIAESNDHSPGRSLTLAQRLHRLQEAARPYRVRRRATAGREGRMHYHARIFERQRYEKRGTRCCGIFRKQRQPVDREWLGRASSGTKRSSNAVQLNGSHD
jgi:Fatty acid synthesis protein